MSSELKIGEICEVLMGQSPPGETCGPNVKGKPLLNGPTEFGPHHPTPVQYTSDPKRISRKGDLLFCVRGSTTGRMNYADQSYAIGRGLAAIRDKVGLPISLAKAVIEYSLPTLLAAASGSTFPSVNRQQIESISVPVSNMNALRGVGKFNEYLEQAIETLRHQNAALEAIAQRLFRSWFVNFDPVHAKAAGNAPEAMSPELAALFPSEFEESALGQIPKGWSIKRIKDLCTRVANGATPSRSKSDYWGPGYDWIKTGELNDGFIVSAKEQITGVGLNNSSAKVFPKHAVLMAIYAAPTVGRLGVLTRPATFNQAATGMVANEPVGPWFLYQALKRGRGWFNNRSNGAAQQNISKDIVENYQVVTPPEGILRGFFKVSNPLYLSIEQNTLLSQKLSELRDHLLPRLISGKLSLADAEAALASVKPEVEPV